jgi:hypothetical protein
MPSETYVLLVAELNARSLASIGYWLSIAVPLILLAAIYVELTRQNHARSGAAPESRRLPHALLCLCLCVAIASLLINGHLAQTQSQRLQTAEAIAADAQISMERERRSMLALQKSLTLRDVRLPPEFDPAKLRAIKGINVELASTHDPEPMKVADNIRSVVEFAGWHVVANEQTDEPLGRGIRIKTPLDAKSEDKSHEAREVLLSIMKNNQVAVASEKADLPPNTLRIEVGPHEQGPAAVSDLN